MLEKVNDRERDMKVCSVLDITANFLTQEIILLS